MSNFIRQYIGAYYAAKIAVIFFNAASPRLTREDGPLYAATWPKSLNLASSERVNLFPWKRLRLVYTLQEQFRFVFAQTDES